MPNLAVYEQAKDKAAKALKRPSKSGKESTKKRKASSSSPPSNEGEEMPYYSEADPSMSAEEDTNT
jgi:hypothetical protein